MALVLRRDFVADMEQVTRDCLKMFFAGTEAKAIKEFQRVEDVMTTLLIKPELLDEQPAGTSERVRKFQFGLYSEFVWLKNGSGIKLKGR